MRKFLPLLILALGLSGCSYMHVHRMNVEQGNVMGLQYIGKIHKGMTEAQVKEVMGEPVLRNVFRPGRMDYVYTNNPGYGAMKTDYMTLIFRGGKLDALRGNMYSQYIR